MHSEQKKLVDAQAGPAAIPGTWQPRPAQAGASGINTSPRVVAQRQRMDDLLGPSHGAPVQRVFSTSKEFKRSKPATAALTGIQNYLKQNDPDMAWAMRSNDIHVEFGVSDQDGSHGTTEVLLGEENLESMALTRQSSLIARLKSPQRIRVKIDIDRKSLQDVGPDGLGSVFVWLAHEVGAHLQPKLGFIRKVVERGGIDERELSIMLASSSAEHEALLHPKDFKKGLPQNTTYLSLVLAFMALVQDEEMKAVIYDYYYQDIERYTAPNSSEWLVRQVARQQFLEANLRRIVPVGFMLLLVIAVALFLLSR